MTVLNKQQGIPDSKRVFWTTSNKVFWTLKEVFWTSKEGDLEQQVMLWISNKVF
jgi:hypothetical protein